LAAVQSSFLLSGQWLPFSRRYPIFSTPIHSLSLSVSDSSYPSHLDHRSNLFSWVGNIAKWLVFERHLRHFEYSFTDKYRSTVSYQMMKIGFPDRIFSRNPQKVIDD
jgi:hypothetical protein